MKDISILIPTYNYVCCQLVEQLEAQASALGIAHEIIVADDGSTDSSCVAANRSIRSLPHCRLLECSDNRGRAAVRNFLSRQAQYEWVLFVDSDMVVVRNDFIRRYAETAEGDIVDGGVQIAKVTRGNLRAIYEQASMKEHTPDKRQKSPYRDFHTANFLARRDILLQWPFDERLRRYGYEDVLFGKMMEMQKVTINHIDNPLSFEVFESNTDFMGKTEEGLQTLCAFREELNGYSRLLEHANRIPRFPVRLWHQLFAGLERRTLTGRHPSLAVFNLYKLGYLVTLLSKKP